MKIRNYLDQCEILCQLAEEASELAQAALKLRRCLDGCNPTPVHEVEAWSNLFEEIADVNVCLDQLDISDDAFAMIEEMEIEKTTRWLKRLEEANAE